MAPAEQANGQASEAKSKAELKELERRKKRKEVKKANKKERLAAAEAAPAAKEPDAAAGPAAGLEGIEIEYVTAPPVADDEDDPTYNELREVLERFARGDEEEGADGEQPEAGTAGADGGAAAEADKAAAEEAEKELSKKKKKLLRRMKVAQLKQLCRRPEVVEMWDVTSNDPQLLVYLKAYRNTVPVPRHWSQKRKFLQGKRGIEKPPWELPDFIAATGIGKVRETAAEKEAEKSLKQKGKDRIQPKMNKIDIDYQILHDAFFKYQSKPKMTAMGELYYEGKEYEVQLGNKKPGVVSDALKAALGMPDGSPPPWLINMQRYGPPPSYTALRIPGLNAPIPPGAMFGYHPGGWGKPPVDEMGNPLYGDVFGTLAKAAPPMATPFDVAVDRVHRWGDLESEEEDEEEDEEEEEEEEEEEGAGAEARSELGEEEMAAGIASIASGYSSLPSGVETPSVIDLRKAGKAAEAPKQLYTVLEERAASVDAKSLMGASHTYVVPGAGGKAAKGGGDKGDVAITLRPEDLEAGLDDADLLARMREAEAAQKAGSAQHEDFSDMVAEHAQKAKRKLDAKKSDKEAKKFKF